MELNKKPMFLYNCKLDSLKKFTLSDIYNSKHQCILDESALFSRIENTLSLSTADLDLPFIVYRDNQLKAFCIAHMSYEEKILGIGQLYFSTLISSGDANALRFMLHNIFSEARKKGFIKSQESVIRGPIHNSILITRGFRTFFEAPFTYQMPDNTPELCDLILEVGGKKEKDLIEIIYDYHPRDTLLMHINNKLLDRFSRIKFSFVQKNEISEYRQELADVYNIAWHGNWGSSYLSAEEIEIAAENIQNIMGMIAKKNNKIIGFTMMQFVESMSVKTGRAFLSGVLPEYQRTGLSIIFTSKLARIAIKNNIKKFSISWMLEDNKMIIRTMQRLTSHGNSLIRRYRIYAVAQANI